MSLKLIVDTSKAAAALGKVKPRELKAFHTAFGVVADQIAKEIHRRGSADILRAGKFSSRWTNDLAVPVTQGENQTKIEVYFRTIDYALVHEFGATIRGKPLLWIPLSFTGITVRARDYHERMFKVNRAGKNPLLVSDTGPKYVGVTHVTLRPRFHLRDITSNVVRTELSRFFFKAWSD